MGHASDLRTLEGQARQVKVFLCQIGGPNGPIWGGGVPHATQVTQAFGLGREVVGCASGDALWVSRKRDDQLRAS